MKRVLIGSVLALIACGSPLGVDENQLPLVSVLPAAGIEEVGAGYRAMLDVSFQNLTDRTIYLRWGCGVEIQQLSEGTWEHVWGGRECLGARERPIQVLRGGVEAWSVSPDFDQLPSGRYRAVLLEISEETRENEQARFAKLIPLELRTSNEFVFEPN